MAPDAIAPDGSEIYYLVPPSPTSAAREDDGVSAVRRASVVEVRLRAGRVTSAVRHRTVEEIWYFLAGTGRVWRMSPDGTVRVTPVAPGAVITIPTGWAFQFEAERDDLRFICWTSPPWPGDGEAEALAPLR
jgi:mannose-6-phosphate isomerase-like protein (cupin superfamily)